MTEESRKGYNWFWNNYNTCMGWIQKHEVAYWKSQTLALKVENEEMFKVLNQNRRKRHPRLLKKSRRKPRERRKPSDNAPEFEFELSPEWAEFFQKSLKHKETLKKERQNEEEVEKNFIPPQDSVDLRHKEMQELYGDESSKILGMETVMDLAFERYIDRNSPEYWPPLPLNLSAV